MSNPYLKTPSRNLESRIYQTQSQVWSVSSPKFELYPQVSSPSLNCPKFEAYPHATSRGNAGATPGQFRPSTHSTAAVRVFSSSLVFIKRSKSDIVWRCICTQCGAVASQVQSNITDWPSPPPPPSPPSSPPPPSPPSPTSPPSPHPSPPPSHPIPPPLVFLVVLLLLLILTFSLMTLMSYICSFKFS